MGWPEYKKDLLNERVDVNHILDKYYHTGPSHVFHGSAPGEEAQLKEAVADALFERFAIRVHTIQLVICGSAHLGFSPVHFKLGDPFNAKQSDIDIAVVSPEIFEAWWTELQSVELADETRALVSQDLFWGFINPANLQAVPGFGTSWWTTFGKMKTERARGVRGRLYKNFWSMQSYHRITVISGRRKLVAKRPAAAAAAPASGGASGPTTK